jgi:integrase
MGRRSTGTVEPLKGCIRLKFTVNGARCVERMNLAPTPANLKAAARLLERIVGAVQAGCYRRGDFFEGSGPATTQTFADYADEWLKTLTVEKSTLDAYRVSLNATWKPAFEGKRLSEIRYSEVKAAVAAKSKAVSGKTVNNALIVLRDIFKTAKADGLVQANPVEGIENLSHQSPAPDPFDSSEMDAILAHMARKFDDRVWNYFTFAFHTGMRPSEIISMRWGDIDWPRRTARVERARVSGEVKGTKTSTIRDVDLSDPALAALKRQKAHTFLLGPDAEVFNSPQTGKPWPDLQVQRRRYFTPTLTALGLRHRDMYQTRHTYATRLLMGGMNPNYIARQLGHRNAMMLFRVYTKWIDGADKGAEAAKLNAILSTNCPADRASS